MWTAQTDLGIKMKKIFVSVGLAAAGAAALPSAIAQTVEAAAPAKMWAISSTLRGFYDDNYNYSNHKEGSLGFEASPRLEASLDLQQTVIGIRYTYGMYYYAQRANDGENPIDHTHQADFWLDHAFNSRVKANLTDSFVVAQDPKLVNGGAITRVGGNNVANHARATITTDWTRKFSTATYYKNDLFIYSDSTSSANKPPNQGTDPSDATLLNRIEQTVGNDFQWHFQPETMGFIGYAYSWARYTGNQKILPSGPPYIYSDARNYNAHYIYVGASHEFTPSLNASGRVGATYIDSYNNPVQTSTSWAPYADISATYTYIPGSYLQVGFREDINSTDVVAPNSNGQLTQYQESSVVYADLNHRITSKLNGSLIGQYQFSKYQDGAYSGQGDDTVSVGVNLNYQINQHFAAEAGYNFDELFSNVSGRGYNRNRVYLGVGAKY